MLDLTITQKTSSFHVLNALVTCWFVLKFDVHLLDNTKSTHKLLFLCCLSGTAGPIIHSELHMYNPLPVWKAIEFKYM